MGTGTVLVVEDDEAIRRGLADALRFHGYEVCEAADGVAGLDAALTRAVDLVVLDLLMPRLDGMSVLARVRESRPDLPVIVLTARGEEADKVRGLRGGADDYVVKPFGLPELLARIEAVLRRSAERPRFGPAIAVGGRQILFDRREVVHAGGQRVPLSERECAVLAYLAAHRGRAVAREELLRRVWGLDPRGVHTRTVDMTVARIREALADDPHEPAVVRTVRGVGYMLAPPDEADHP